MYRLCRLLLYVPTLWLAVSAQDTPMTYDLLLTFTAETFFTNYNNRSMFLSTYAKAGFSQSDVEDRGRSATAWALEKFGVDFTDIDPEFYTEGVVERYDGAVAFQPFYFAWPDSEPYRLVSAVNHTHSALFTNAPVRDIGWMIVFQEDFNTTGNLSLPLPAGSAAYYGDYLIDVLYDDREREDPFFPEEALDNEVLRIESQTVEVQYPPAMVPPGRRPFLIFDFEVYSRTYGGGVEQGVASIQTGDVRIVMRFPDGAL